MSTAVYARMPIACPHCSKPVTGDARMHLGRYAIGWRFLLRTYPDEGIHCWADWKAKLEQEGVLITDEYGHDMTPDEFFESVECVKDDRSGVGYAGGHIHGREDMCDLSSRDFS